MFCFNYREISDYKPYKFSCQYDVKLYKNYIVLDSNPVAQKVLIISDYCESW